jgi:uncharacterized protein
MCYSVFCNYPFIVRINPVNQSRNQLRLNVGFIISQPIGYSRDFTFEISHLHLSTELDLDDFSGFTRIGRTQQGLILQAKYHCTIKTECVRCLTETVVPLQTEFDELYAFTTRSVSESGLILPEDGHIDLEPLLREYLTLEVPIRPLCRPDCKGLCIECGENLNERLCEHQTKQPGI